jgi:hypothetical protein
MKSFNAFFKRRTAFALFALLFASVHAQAQTDPLPAWNDGPCSPAIARRSRSSR